MTVLVQPMPWLRTVAFSINLQAGLVQERFQPDDPQSRAGLASLVCEMVQRGAGRYSSRDLAAAQDNLGIERSSGVSSSMVNFGGAMPSDSLPQAIELYADILRRPHLPADQLDDAKMMAVQEIRASEDEPGARVMKRLKELQYGVQLGRSPMGTEPSVLQLTQDDVREFYVQNYHAGGGILAVAGNVEADQVFDWISDALGDWKTGPEAVLPEPMANPSTEFIQADSSQTHIGFSFDSVPYGHEDYFKMRAAIGILSDGMSSRLFDRVREQRGLCYTISAGCHSLQNVGGVFGYAGTTPERAQETLDVSLREIEHLADDLQAGELERWRVRIESALIMEQESSQSRASSIASDQYQVGHVISTRELESIIESLTLEEIQSYWRHRDTNRYSVVTLGQEPLVVPHT
ncbi:MAG: pitrilysin family protein [Planctomycetota bacterium]